MRWAQAMRTPVSTHEYTPCCVLLLEYRAHTRPQLLPNSLGENA